MVCAGGVTPTGAQGHIQCPVYPLHHAIGLRVLGCGGDVLESLLFTPVSLHARGKLGPPVGGDAGWHAKVGHLHSDEGLQHLVWVNAAQRDSLWPPRRAVHHSQQVS